MELNVLLVKHQLLLTDPIHKVHLVFQNKKKQRTTHICWVVVVVEQGVCIIRLLLNLYNQISSYNDHFLFLTKQKTITSKFTTYLHKK